MSPPARAYQNRAGRDGGRARWRLCPAGAVAALAITLVSLPAAATSAITVAAFGDLCLDRALSGKPVKPAALARGMEITGEVTPEESHADAPKQRSTTWAGIPVTVATGSGFGANQNRASLPEGIIVLQLGMGEATAEDPAGRNVALVTCFVESTEEPAAARPLIEIERQLTDRLPQEAVASGSSSRISEGITNDRIKWSWGDIDSSAGRFRVGYSGRSGPCFMGGGMLTADRVVRAPE